MVRAVLQEILSRLEALEVDELRVLDQAIQQHIADRVDSPEQVAFHQALLSFGLVKQIKRPVYRQMTQEQLIQVEGKPISETIIEERR